MCAQEEDVKTGEQWQGWNQHSVKPREKPEKSPGATPNWSTVEGHFGMPLAKRKDSLPRATFRACDDDNEESTESGWPASVCVFEIS